MFPRKPSSRNADQRLIKVLDSVNMFAGIRDIDVGLRLGTAPIDGSYPLDYQADQQLGTRTSSYHGPAGSMQNGSATSSRTLLQCYPTRVNMDTRTSRWRTTDGDDGSSSGWLTFNLEIESLSVADSVVARRLPSTTQAQRLVWLTASIGITPPAPSSADRRQISYTTVGLRFDSEVEINDADLCHVARDVG